MMGVCGVRGGEEGRGVLTWGVVDVERQGNVLGDDNTA